MSGYLSNEGENLMLLSFNQLVDDFESEGWALCQERPRTFFEGEVSLPEPAPAIAILTILRIGDVVNGVGIVGVGVSDEQEMRVWMKTSGM